MRLFEHSKFNIRYSTLKLFNLILNNEQRTTSNEPRPNQIVVVKQRRKVQEQCSKTRKYDERLALRTSFRGSFQDEMIQA